MTRLAMPTACRHGRRELGQSLVEFAVLVPVFMLILIGMLEFGLMFNHDLTLQYASREGARVGAALGCGATGNNPTCDSGLSAPNPTEVDPYVVAAVQRVLEASGSPINMANIGSVTIFKATSTGASTGSTDTWIYSKGNGPQVDGVKLDFIRSGSNGWPDNSPRVTSATTTVNCGNGLSACPDSIGIKITYTYQYVTPLAAVMRFFGGPAASTQGLNDQTVMALNPTS